VALEKRSVRLAGHPTSLALEPEFWAALERIARREALTLSALINQIDQNRGEQPLASACRVKALNSLSD
jgi:predicted DNA-binding ribbon-helix-helix protein